ncbi:MAG: sensor histidine kinase, partial [Desulfobulbus sp.]
HELNQPLAAIRAYGANGRELLIKGRIEEAIANFDRIAELTERMAGIGSQLKIFSRKSRGNLGSLPLQGVVDGALEILMPMLGKTGIKIDIDLDPPDIRVWANSLLLQQALVNLITNGVHAVQGQEHKQNQKTPIVAVSGRFFEDMVRVEVRDNGPGIGVADREMVFDPFYTTKPSGQGLGLGLTITRRIIEEMDGHIYLEEGGAFTTFVLLLHREPAE